MVFQGSGVCPSVDALVKALKEREEIMSTGIGFGIAIPHAQAEDGKGNDFRHRHIKKRH